MKFRQLLLQNLKFHWRANLAVLLGVAVGAAVLAGALTVGDSLRGSLKDRAEFQRAGVDFAWTGRFIHEPESRAFTPMIMIPGEVRVVGRGNTTAHLTILGVDQRFWDFEAAGQPQLQVGAARRDPTDSISITPVVQRLLNIDVNDKVVLRLPKQSAIARESILGHRDAADVMEESQELRVDIVTNASAPATGFSLVPSSMAPKNLFVPLKSLQRILKQPDEINTLIAGGSDKSTLQQELDKSLSLSDWDITPIQRDKYVSIESKQMMIEPAVAGAVERAASAERLRIAPTLVYLANSIVAEGKQPIPYSIVAALDPTAAPPLGPFLPPGVESLKDDEIVLADWADSPLRGLPAGAKITLTYFEPELKDGKQVESKATFTLRGFVPMTGPANDPNLTPAFPGITDKLSVRDWKPPFEYDNSRIRPRDEKYWREHKTTPKAYVRLAAGRKLWASRFGDATSIRVAGAQNLDQFKEKLRSELRPEEGGFVFQDIKSRFEAAGQGGQDFGGLFLGFSFFLIVSALLLVGLLTRLNLERRASEIGLLIATGWRLGTVRRLLLIEGLLVAAIGGILGLIAAVAFADGMLELLRELWPDQSVGTFLRLHVTSMSMLIGYFGMLIITAITVWWALRMLNRAAASALIAGSYRPQVEGIEPKAFWSRLGRRLPASSWGAFLLPIAIACLTAGAFVGNPMFRALTFFAGGGLLLTAALMLVWRWLKRESPEPISGHGPVALARLGIRNASRNPGRSLLTAGLLASAAFLLVAVESFRRQPEKDFEKITGGSGGCPLLVQTSLPVFKDLNSDGRDDLLSTLQQHYQRQPNEKLTPTERADQAQKLLEQTKIYSFRKLGGDDASCLNLYQAGRPQMLGVPQNLIARGGFHFIDTDAKSDEEKANPWLMLNRSAEDDAIPAIAEQNTLTWMLKKDLGDTYEIPDENGRIVKLRFVGVLKDSVFQSELLISAANFAKLFPHTEGFTYHLVETSPDRADAVADLLRDGLAKQGAEISRSKDHVATYMAVENTYLTTFQLLGGFGMLLGAFGLAVVMLRAAWERRGELALLRALGYRNSALNEMVMAENAMLLLVGLLVGIGTALLSVLPHLALGGSLPITRLTILLAVVLLAGLIAGYLAIRSTLRAPLLAALRKE